MTRIAYLPPWQPIDPDRAEILAQEFQREIGPTHPLFGQDAHAIAMRGDCDDVLFSLHRKASPSDDFPHTYAIVHLTWKGTIETDPRWPSTAVFPDWDSAANHMYRDHLDYLD